MEEVGEVVVEEVGKEVVKVVEDVVEVVRGMESEKV